MYKVARTWARPTQVVRVPRRVPLSRLKGATPTRAARRWRLSVPNSGRSSTSVRAHTGPMPGTLRYKVSRAPDGTRPQRGVQVVIQGAYALVEPDDMGLDVGPQTARRMLKAVLLGGPHRD